MQFLVRTGSNFEEIIEADDGREALDKAIKEAIENGEQLGLITEIVEVVGDQTYILTQFVCDRIGCSDAAEQLRLAREQM